MKAKQEGLKTKALIKQTYYNKFYTLFMSNYEWEGIDYQAEDFLMRRFWADGTVSAFKLKHTNQPVFCPYAPIDYNLYDYPVHLTLIDRRGVGFIPSTPQTVDKDVVIGYAQKNKKPVREIIDWYATKIADIEMAIRQNLRAIQTPYVFKGDKYAEQQFKNITEKINACDDNIYLTDDSNQITVLNTGANYMVDKLYNYKQALENEVLTYLGVNNIGSAEKKEHLITAEVDSNNQLINQNGENFVSMMESFCKRIKEVLGIEISVRLKCYEQEGCDPQDKYSDESDEQSEEDEKTDDVE